MLAPYVGTHVGYVFTPAGSVNLGQRTDRVSFYALWKDLQSTLQLPIGSFHNIQADISDVASIIVCLLVTMTA